MDLGGGLWGFRGFTTKAGTYLVTVKAALNGNTVTQRVALKVNALPAWAKGTFNGGILRRGLRPHGRPWLPLPPRQRKVETWPLGPDGRAATLKCLFSVAWRG